MPIKNHVLIVNVGSGQIGTMLHVPLQAINKSQTDSECLKQGGDSYYVQWLASQFLWCYVIC